MNDDRPLVLLFRLGDLPLVRSTLLPLYPLPEAFLDRPFWMSRAGVEGARIFDTLHEGPVDPVHHAHVWAMLEDIHRLMMDDPTMRRRVHGDTDKPRYSIGYHTTAHYDDVARFFARPFEVVHLRDEVAQRAVERDDEETVRTRLVRHLGFEKHPSRERERLYDALVGEAPLPTDLGRVPSAVTNGMRDRVPSRFTPLDDRCLQVLVRQPERLSSLEGHLRLSDPLLDQHAIWREKLLARGMSEEALERAAAPHCVRYSDVTSRTWWLLGRAAPDVSAFLARHRDAHHFRNLVRHLLFASLVTWRLPRFWTVGEALLRDHLDDFNVSDLLNVRFANVKRATALLLQHADAIRERFADDPDVTLDDILLAP